MQWSKSFLALQFSMNTQKQLEHNITKENFCVTQKDLTKKNCFLFIREFE